MPELVAELPSKDNFCKPTEDDWPSASQGLFKLGYRFLSGKKSKNTYSNNQKTKRPICQTKLKNIRLSNIHFTDIPVSRLHWKKNPSHIIFQFSINPFANLFYHN